MTAEELQTYLAKELKDTRIESWQTTMLDWMIRDKIRPLFDKEEYRQHISVRSPKDSPMSIYVYYDEVMFIFISVKKKVIDRQKTYWTGKQTYTYGYKEIVVSFCRAAATLDEALAAAKQEKLERLDCQQQKDNGYIEIVKYLKAHGYIRTSYDLPSFLKSFSDRAYDLRKRDDYQALFTE